MGNKPLTAAAELTEFCSVQYRRYGQLFSQLLIIVFNSNARPLYRALCGMTALATNGEGELQEECEDTRRKAERGKIQTSVKAWCRKKSKQPMKSPSSERRGP